MFLFFFFSFWGVGMGLVVGVGGYGGTLLPNVVYYFYGLFTFFFQFSILNVSFTLK